MLEMFGRRRQWRLFHGETVMECFIANLRPAGAEIRFVYRGELCRRFVHASRENAERESRSKRRQLLHVGWCEERVKQNPEPPPYVSEWILRQP
jgi:hypothetical protein